MAVRQHHGSGCGPDTEASSGRELLDVVAATVPDVVLTDLATPNLDGAAATRALLADHPGLPVLMLTMHDYDESVFAAVRAARWAIYSRVPTGPN